MDANKLTTIICSKNRPLQLYALLESLQEKTNICFEDTYVLYKYDNKFIEALSEVNHEFSNVHFINEYNFKENISEIISKNVKSYVMFLMDDDIIKEEINFKEITKYMDENPIFTFSLRMGKNLNYCYPVNKQQAIPTGYDLDNYFMWNFREGEFDWNYPLSLDGHVFEKHEFERILKMFNGWNSPNTLEACIQPANNIINPICVCYQQSRLVNLPINKVQNDFNNRSGNVSEGYLLNVWNNKKKINLQTIYGLNNDGAHQEINLEFCSR
jgi:hypothetical protein